MNRHSRTLLTVLIAGAVLVPYWLLARRDTTSGSSDPLTPSSGGKIVSSIRNEPRSFNRLVTAEQTTDLITHLTQGKLVRINRTTGDVEPWLAEKWTTSSDGRTFTLTLREGLTWSDGTPFTSNDVLFTFAAIRDPRTTSPFSTALTIGGQPIQVTATDARTVVVTYAEVFGPGIRLLDTIPIVPKHKLEAALNAGTLAKAWAADTPPSEVVGMGPFVFVQYEPAVRLVFARNPRYWRRDSRGVQLPYADQLTFEIVPDQDAELVRLQAGQIDFMQQTLRASDLETLRPLEREGRIQIIELGVNLDADTLVFNLRPDKWTKDPRRAWLPRKEFRQAISHAVDREAYANTVFLGAAVPVHGPITSGNTRWFSPNVPRYEFSREKARTLLEGLGLRNRDEDEWIEDDKGADARFTVLTFRGNRVLERGATVLREDLRHVGIAVDVVPLESLAVRQRVVAGDFECAFIALVTTDPDPALTKDLWLSSGAARFWNPAQKIPATDWERQMDELMVKQTTTLDEAARKQLFNEVQRIFAENLPMLHFAAPRVFVGASKRLTNLQPSVVRPYLLWSPDTLAVVDASRSQ